jgi:hypothetical protein
MKEKILKEKSAEDIAKIVESGHRDMSESIKMAANQMATIGHVFHRQEEMGRFEKIHAKKIRILEGIMKIIRNSQIPEKVHEINGLLAIGFLHEVKRGMVELPPADQVKKWLKDEMLLIAFLDEWEIREALGKKCRCTPYFFYHSTKDDSYWARALPHGGETAGMISRYYIEDLGKSDRKHRVRVNYFNPEIKITDRIVCALQPVKGFSDRFTVKVPAAKGKATIELLLREENGQKIFYRKISAEKLFVAKVLEDKKQIPSHSAIDTTRSEGMTAVYIKDRLTLSEIDHLRESIEDLGSSIGRDRQNKHYQPKDPEKANPFNVNQLLFIAQKRLLDNRTYVTAVDNWRENSLKTEFEPLLDDPTELVGIIRFLATEAKEDEIILGHIAEIDSLNGKIQELQKELEQLKQTYGQAK